MKPSLSRALFLLAVVTVLVVVAVLALLGRGSDDPASAPRTGDAPEIATPTPESGVRRVAVGEPAPEITGILGWINSDPLRLEDLRGKVVLIDFWTYTCVNCIRTFPYLREWHDKYADDGLVIIGVHTPEFEFEKIIGNVREATLDNDLRYAVAIDSDRATWDAFQNRFWPRKYLIDQNGILRFDHAGEGRYQSTESWIQRLLIETGADVSGVELVMDPERAALAAYRQVTPELYAGARGALSGHIGNFSRQAFQTPYLYGLPRTLGDDALYLEGAWITGEESILHARSTDEFVDKVHLSYWARSVNLVIRPERPEPFEVEIMVDGQPLDEHDKGLDVTIKDGRSFVTVDEPRLYFLVSHLEPGGHALQLSAKSDAFAFFAFTFGVAAD